jgi:hypothetical protein
MRIVDDVILGLLRAAVPPNAAGEPRVHDGYVPVADTDARVVTAALPYLAYFSSLGDDSNRRLSGENGRRSVFFQVTYVGEDRAQAKWAGERQRAALCDKAIVVAGHKTWRVLLGESQRIRRDDDAARPDGSPLFYGVDLYSVAITRKPNE